MDVKLTPYTNINSIKMEDLNRKRKNLNTSELHIEEYDFRAENNLLNKAQKVQTKTKY